MKSILAAVMVALLVTCCSAQQEQQQQQQQQQDQQLMCTVIVVNALAVEIPMTVQIGDQSVEGIMPEMCELALDVPCGGGVNGSDVEVRITPQQDAAQGENQTQQCPAFIGLIEFNTTGQMPENQTQNQTEQQQQEQEQQQQQRQEQQQETEQQQQQNQTQQYVHYLVISHKIQLPEGQARPENVVGTFPVTYQDQTLPVTLLYERAQLTEVQENEVGLALWHTAANAPFTVLAELYGTPQEQQQQQQQQQRQEQQQPEGEVVESFPLEPYQRQDWATISPDQVQTVVLRNATQQQGEGEPELTQEQLQQQQVAQQQLGETETEQQPQGDILFQEDIQQQLSQFTGQLVTGFVIGQPPQLAGQQNQTQNQTEQQQQGQEQQQQQQQRQEQQQEQQQQETQQQQIRLFFTDCAAQFMEMMQQPQQPEQPEPEQPEQPEDVVIGY